MKTIKVRLDKCPYCEKGDDNKLLMSKDIPIKGMKNASLSTITYISGNYLATDVFSYDEGGIFTQKKINYCPMCGRRINLNATQNLHS